MTRGTMDRRLKEMKVSMKAELERRESEAMSEFLGHLTNEELTELLRRDNEGNDPYAYWNELFVKYGYELTEAQRALCEVETER